VRNCAEDEGGPLGAGFFLCRLETVRSQEECWQERYDGRLSRADLWGRGGEIPLRYPTPNCHQIIFQQASGIYLAIDNAAICEGYYLLEGRI
jgi:hypothetical protein